MKITKEQTEFLIALASRSAQVDSFTFGTFNGRRRIWTGIQLANAAFEAFGLTLRMRRVEKRPKKAKRATHTIVNGDIRYAKGGES